MIRRALLATAALALVLAAPASAHVQVRPALVAPGDPVLFQVIVPNESDAHTVEVVLQVPKDVLPFSFEEPDGWTRENKEGADGSLETITWKGELAEDGFARFSFLASTPEQEGEIVWKSIQTYDDGSVSRWIGAPDADNPAAVTTVSQVRAARERGRRRRVRRGTGRRAPRPCSGRTPPPAAGDDRGRLRLPAPAHPVRGRARARRLGPPARAPLTMIRTALAALFALLLAAPVALAHEGNPNYRSVVKSVTPATKGVDVSVLNFDDRLLLHNTSNQDVTIYDYEKEPKPYAQVLADGTVQVNTNSKAYYLNADRQGQTAVPAEPRRRAAVEGPLAELALRVARPPRALDGQGDPPNLTDKSVETKIDDWEVPISVGDQKGQIAGTLTWVPLDDGGLPLPAIFAFAGLVIALCARGLRRAPPPRRRPRSPRRPSKRGEGARPRS